MPTFDDVVRIAKTLDTAGARIEINVAHGKQGSVGVAVGAKSKGIAWMWNERVELKKPKVPNPRVIAVRVRDELEKQLLLDGDPAVYFTEPHYNGYPAVLVRLEVVTTKELTSLLKAALARQLATMVKTPRATKPPPTTTKPSSKRASRPSSTSKRATTSKRVSKPSSKKR